MNRYQGENTTRSGRKSVYFNNDFVGYRMQQPGSRPKSGTGDVPGDLGERGPLLAHSRQFKRENNNNNNNSTSETAIISNKSNYGSSSHVKVTSSSSLPQSSSSSSASAASSYLDILSYCHTNKDIRVQKQKQTRGFGSVFLSMLVLTFFATTLIVAIHHASEDDTSLMMRVAERLIGDNVHKHSGSNQSGKTGIVHSHNDNDVNIKMTKEGIAMEVNKQGSTQGGIQQQPSLCTIDAPGEWNLNMNKRCPHEFTTITVPSMGQKHGYKWPKGFSWTILKDDDEADTSSSDVISRQFLAAVSNTTVSHRYNEDSKCDEYVTALCLQGTYVIYANSDEVDDLDQAKGESVVCNRIVKVGEALDFSIRGNSCYMDNHVDERLSKSHDRASKDAKNVEVTHVKDYSLSMVSFSIADDLSTSYLHSSVPSLSSRIGDKEDAEKGNDRDSKDDDGKNSEPTVPPTGSWVSPDSGETLNPLVNNSVVDTIGNFTHTYLTLFPTAAPTPSVSTMFFNNSDNCYSIPGFPKIYCYRDYQTSFPTPQPTERVPGAPTNCLFFGLFSDCSGTDTPTSMPTTHIMNPEINQQMEDDVIAQQNEDTHDATRIEDKENKETQKKFLEAGRNVGAQGHKIKRQSEKVVHKTEIVIAKERQHDEDELKREEREYSGRQPASSIAIPKAHTPLTARQRANEVERIRDQNIARNVKATVSNIYDSMAKGQTQGDEHENGQTQGDEYENGQYMMNLHGADESTPYSLCMSRYEHPLAYLDIEVAPGCISLFTNDISKQMYSYVTTYCGCEEMGPRMYDINALVRSRLVNKKDMQSAVSFIATGREASIAFYNSPRFATEQNSSKYREVLGPGRRVSLDSYKMGDSGRSWNNQVYSIILDAWSSCDAPPIPCNDITTQSPITSPTQAPGSRNSSLLVKTGERDTALDRMIEVEGEKDSSFLKFVSELASIEKSYLHIYDAVEMPAERSNLHSLSSSATVNSKKTSHQIHPMALQVKGREAREDELSSAYFEDEIDTFDDEKQKRWKSKDINSGSRSVSMKTKNRSHSNLRHRE